MRFVPKKRKITYLDFWNLIDDSDTAWINVPHKTFWWIFRRIFWLESNFRSQHEYIMVNFALMESQNFFRNILIDPRLHLCKVHQQLEWFHHQDGDHCKDNRVRFSILRLTPFTHSLCNPPRSGDYISEAEDDDRGNRINPPQKKIHYALQPVFSMLCVSSSSRGYAAESSQNFEQGGIE